MIVTLVGIVLIIVLILLVKNAEKNKKKFPSPIVVYITFPIAISIIIIGISEPTKMGEWEYKEAIEATLISNEEENSFAGYTYQYLIPEKVIEYTTKRNVAPILVKCERKAKPTIWTLGVGQKETKYVFHFPNDIIN